jgi:hypothetical protein
VGDAQYRQARGNEAVPAIEGGAVMKRLAICYREAATPIRRRQAAYKKAARRPRESEGTSLAPIYKAITKDRTGEEAAEMQLWLSQKMFYQSGGRRPPFEPDEKVKRDEVAALAERFRQDSVQFLFVRSR